jgi:hypothetical protein
VTSGSGTRTRLTPRSRWLRSLGQP